MVRAIKIPYGLPSALCPEREKSQKGYNVNRLIRTVDFYLCLKSESHKIHFYRKQLSSLLRLCKCSEATFYARLKSARELGLIKIEGKKHILLASWEKLSNVCGYAHTNKFHTANYDTNKPGQILQYYIKGYEDQENKERQIYAIAKRLAANPSIEAAFKEFCHREGIRADFNNQNHLAAKIQAFAEGTESSLYDVLHSFNPSLSRNIKTLARAHGYKDWQGAAYLKHQLITRGLAEILRFEPAKCVYKGNKPEEGIKKGNTKHGRFYDAAEKAIFWYRPDEIALNPILFFAPETSQQNPANTAA